ncbi:GNAT family N-acetyltransferase [Neobacillus sp. OS1-32]|jgi:RimJ/RimL family protein N-acetyltransferase|uniref:GNAT family N-acetyltransferase n=1 Tax=Neobacillus paridis TaxID=2803862 RepID=A0ABS1TQQ0_9BACI|nr:MULTISPECIES: GNAT family N-acetyltransferase [Neobacillus]MBL4953084.1 GNAT family N-acetyltransferase [Neobacillus paridis]WML31397.1 GNAT family N-acetyltransferase [Neobacillus sp. OS1-32]
MDIKIARTKMKEAAPLLKIQKQAFQADLKKYRDYDSSPAAESLDFFIYRMGHSLHYTVYLDGKMAGGICLVKISDDHFRLFRVFLSPEFQNKGLGTRILKMLEKQYPEVTKWSLDTPKDHARNRRFYEKFGYQQTGEFKVNNRLTLIEYEKNIRRKPP